MTIGYAVKALGNGAIEAYGVRWGSPYEPDRSKEQDFFTTSTDLMLNDWAWPRPIFLEHMASDAAQRAGSVGQWHGATKDSVGVKLRGQLKTDHALYAPLAADIAAGRYYLSSDSAPQFVKRSKMPNGTNRLDRWGLLTCSLTRSPAEHRLLPVAMVKALALKAGARHSTQDQTHLQTAHDSLVRAGATCATTGKHADPRAARLLAEIDDLLWDIEDEKDARRHALLSDLAELERG